MTPVPTLTASSPAELSAFRACLQASNPFLDNRINGPSRHDPDVPQVHQSAFARLTGLAEDALRTRRGLGVMLWGEAGIGKSHVLSRLGRWADGKACLVYLHNLQAAPGQLPRSLLRSVISQLTQGQRRQLYGTPLFALVQGMILASLPPGERRLPWARIQRAYDDWVDQLVLNDLPGAALLDRAVYKVLFHFFRSVCEQRLQQGDGRGADLAVRWLTGDGLDPEEAEVLNLPPATRRDEAVALLDTQQIKQVLVALTRLAVCQQRPFVLAFDQVDNLDGEQFAALARFLEALIDSASNLLVVTAGVQASLVVWHERGVIQESAWHRLAQIQIPLHRIGADEASQIVRTRLQAFLQPFRHLEAVAHRMQADALFPLGESWRRQILQDRVDLRPRDVINWACEGWRHLQERLRRETANWLLGSDEVASPSPLAPVAPRTLAETEIQERIDRQVSEQLADRLAYRQNEPQTLPPDEDRLIQLLGDLLRWLRERVPALGLTSVEQMEPHGPVPAPHQLVVIRQLSGGGSLRTGVVVLATANKKTNTNSLRRLVNGAGVVDRQLLISDARTGLPLGPKGQAYLRQLEEQSPQQFLTLEISFADYAAVDALHSVIGLARSGELGIEPGQPGVPGAGAVADSPSRPVTVEEAVTSLFRQGRFQDSRLLGIVLSGEWTAELRNSPRPSETEPGAKPRSGREAEYSRPAPP